MLYRIAVYVHLLSAMAWLGGTLFLVAVVAPVARRYPGPPGEGARFLRAVARRFVPIAWGCIGLLVLTGVFMAWDHWNVTPARFVAGAGWPVGVLRTKLGLVLAVVVLSALHDFVLGPRVSRAVEEGAARGVPGRGGAVGRRRLVWLARANLALALAIVALGVLLVRGSPP